MPELASTKDRLLAAAVEVIDNSGIKELRIRDIAALAGVKEPSVYHFYGSRDALVEAAQAFRYTRG
ncbi:TetR/AcrR family transcriptional regulator [Aurantimicrobium minutum]|uniref:TetR/AcrR family transcriptional regulator n=1 Tax=Aurantimicrobium minutum TaxID=708131 RepID=UPI002475F899|nr:helix-turn-helix domain-containing protein [Aurantimicrobium minutum]MDH6239286.1 AcrR family transcriptional regulator [Aurantimicrobium minutum]